MSMNVTSETMEAVTRATGLSAEALAEARAEIETFAGGFQGPADITSIAGLPGTYLWTEFGTAQAITFALSTPTTGTYSITNFVSLVESGTFIFTPSTTPPGFAVLQLQPSVGSDRFFAITGLFEFNGQIQNIQLRKLAPVSFPPQFSAVRMSP